MADSQAEVRAGLSVGSHSASAAAFDIAPRLSLDAVLKLRALPSWTVFGGYYRTAFGCEEGFCAGRPLAVVGRHGAVGAEWTPLVERLGGRPWVRAGVLLGSTEAGRGGESVKQGFGLELGAGGTVPMGVLVLYPGISYRRLGADTASQPAHAVAVSLQLGIGVKLGVERSR